MTLWLPEHFNQFHPRSPEQNQRGKEDKVTILWMDTVFSLYEAVSLYKEERELCEDPTVPFLIEVPSSGLLGSPCHTHLAPASSGSH